jgi:hypothetical protein
MHSPTKFYSPEWQDRIDIPLRMQRPMGAVFAGMSLSCALAFVAAFAGLVLQMKRSHGVDVAYFAVSMLVLIAACAFFGKIGFRLLTKRENRAGRASGRSLPAGSCFVYPFLFLSLAMLVGANFLTGPGRYVYIIIISGSIGSEVATLLGVQRMHNQSRDPALASGTPDAEHQSRHP